MTPETLKVYGPLMGRLGGVEPPSQALNSRPVSFKSLDDQRHEDYMTPDLICGIDPGLSGGISMLTMDGAVWLTSPMPETEQEVAELLGEFAPRIAKAFIERVQPMPTGTVAMFKLGRSYGTLRGILTTLQVPLDEVRPQVWQTAMGCLSKGKKAVTRQRAQALFPKCPDRITDKIADSLLIAEYGRRNH